MSTQRTYVIVIFMVFGAGLAAFLTPLAAPLYADDLGGEVYYDTPGCPYNPVGCYETTSFLYDHGGCSALNTHDCAVTCPDIPGQVCGDAYIHDGHIYEYGYFCNDPANPCYGQQNSCVGDIHDSWVCTPPPPAPPGPPPPPGSPPPPPGSPPPPPACSSTSPGGLRISLSANPASGPATLSSQLIASFDGQGPFENLYFSWDCRNDGTWDMTSEYAADDGEPHILWSPGNCNYGTAGTYTARVQISSSARGTACNTTTISVSPAPAPTISLNPKSFAFTGVSGSPLPDPPATRTLTISNTGNATLNYTARTDQDWCRVNGVSSSGSITGSVGVAPDSDSVTVSVDAPSNVGSFACTITVSDPAATNSPQTATVTYSVTAPPLPPVAPSNLVASNPTCSQVRLTWQDNSSNEDGFRLYVKTGTTSSSNLADYTFLIELGANATSYTYSPPTGQTYQYAVLAFNSAGVSPAAISNLIYNNACAADLRPSSKTIALINGAPYTGQTLREGDTLTFRLVISNVGEAVAYDVFVVDTLTPTLAYELGSAKRNGIRISETNPYLGDPNKVRWPAAPGNLGDLPPSTNWILTYEATLVTSSTQVIDFFDNAAAINYQDPLGTPKSYPPPFPLTPFRTGQGRSPDIKEIAP